MNIKNILIGSLLFAFITTAAVAAPMPAMPPTTVSAVEAKTIEWQQDLAETGTLVALNGIVVKSEVDGRITQIYFESGQTVKKDAPLFQLNADVLAALLKQDEANLDQRK